MKNTHTIQRILPYLPVVGLLCILGEIAFPYSIYQQITLISTGVFFVLDYVVNQRWKTWQWTRDKWAYVFPIVMWLLLVVWQVLGIERLSTHTHLERQMPLMILGVVGIATIPNVLRKEWFALVALTIVLLQSIWIMLHIPMGEMFAMMNSTMNVFNDYRIHHMSSHMAFNLYANMALVLGYAALSNADLGKAWKIGLGVEMALTVVVLSITEGRIGFATMLLLVALMAIVAMWKRSKWASVVVAIAGVVAGVLLVQHVLEVRAIGITNDPRSDIFRVAWEQIEERPIMGYGAQSGHEEFVQRGLNDEQFYQHYALMIINDPIYGIDRIGVMHPHNAFLEAWIAHGIWGLLILIGVILCPMIVAPKPQRMAVVMCCLVFWAQAMFERIGNDLSPLLYMLVLLVVMHRDAKRNDAVVLGTGDQPHDDGHDASVAGV